MPRAAAAAVLAALAAASCLAGAAAISVRTTVEYSYSPMGPCLDTSAIARVRSVFSGSPGLCLPSDAEKLAGSACSEAGGSFARTFCREVASMPHHRGLPGWPFAEAIGHLETSPVTVEYVYEGGTVSCGGPGEAPALPESGLKEASFTFADCTPVSKTACYPGSRGGEDAVLSACARFGDHTFFGSPGNAPPLRQQDHRLAARQTFRDCGSNRTCCEGHMLATGASSIEGCVSECRDWDRCAAVNFEPRTGICRLYDSRCTRWTASPGTLFRSSRAACPAQGCPAAPPPPQGYVPFAGCAAGRSCCDAPVRIVHTADLGDCEEACWALGDGNRELCRAVNYYPATKECRMHTNGCDVAGFVAPGVVVTAMNATDCPPARDRPSNLCFPWVGMPAVRRTTSRRPATTKKRTTSRKRTSTKKRTTTKKRRTTTPPIIMPNA